jgi:hypothetical protein
MAGKRATKVSVTAKAKAERTTRPVRLDMPVEHVERLERAARRIGLSMSSYCRMAVLERIERDETKGGPR